MVNQVQFYKPWPQGHEFHNLGREHQDYIFSFSYIRVYMKVEKKIKTKIKYMFT